MEAIKTRLKTIAWFLTALMLFQSCVVYHKTPTTLEKASEERLNTKVTNNEGETTKFKHITYENGQFYGVSKKGGEVIKMPLDQKSIQTVLIKNRTASILVSIGVVTGSIFIVIISWPIWGGINFTTPP